MMTSTGTQHVRSTNDSVNVKHRTFEHSNRLTFERDTTYVLDSVMIETRNDTVYHTHWRTMFRDRLVERRDTVEVRDTIRVETFSQSVSSDSVIVSPRASPPHGNGKEATPSWCWKLLIWNIFIVIILLLLYLLRKQLFR